MSTGSRSAAHTTTPLVASADVAAIGGATHPEGMGTMTSTLRPSTRSGGEVTSPRVVRSTV